LITEDDALKIVDFGVSEMFEKDSIMNTSKSVGSPAFMPPELCVAKHGEVSGRACDIWSMGVTLYCFRHGHIPFEKTGVLELYESIKTDDVQLGPKCGEDFKDLMVRILEKDPDKRIRMEELREHPWVTKRGADLLLPKEENTALLIEPPTEEELNNAITGNMGGLMAVMKAVKRFKQLLIHKRPELLEGIFGNSSRFVQPPLSMNSTWRTHSSDLETRKPTEYALAAEGIHRDIQVSDDLKKLPEKLGSVAIHTSDTPSDATEGSGAAREAEKLRKSSPLPDVGRNANLPYKQNRKGQAHNPLEDTLYLGVGTGSEEPVDPGTFAAVCDSPGATDFNVYERAYQEEVERIVGKEADETCCPTIFLTRRVDHVKNLRDKEYLVDHLHDLKDRVPVAANAAFKKIVEQTKANVDHAASVANPKGDPASGSGVKKIVEQAKENREAAKASTASASQDESVMSKIGFNKLIGKAKQHIEAARPTKTATGENN
jgi:[calcium/calmodulin-dependent protein kinase] kinase